ncbi:hypothetical protein RUND412_000609 [Rhizina undulata]
MATGKNQTRVFSDYFNGLTNPSDDNLYADPNPNEPEIASETIRRGSQSFSVENFETKGPVTPVDTHTENTSPEKDTAIHPLNPPSTTLEKSENKTGPMPARNSQVDTEAVREPSPAYSTRTLLPDDAGEEGNKNSVSKVEAFDEQPSTPASEASVAGLNVLRGGMREMVELVKRLRASGIEDLGLPLPRIAVVGNQSAGKSSLIEAISEIKVPRYTGTCTRCPLEISLSESTNADDPWQCRISLRFKKRYAPDNQSETRSNPWEDQPMEQVHFCDVTDKDQVEPVLVRAQRAVLSPGKNWRDFINEPGERGFLGRSRVQAWAQKGGKWSGHGNGKRNMDCVEGMQYEVKFSPNVVCMEITGPNLPNLAFIDLPGVIQTTESESEHYLIELVSGLVKEYVQSEDCLILLAMTMRDDAVNQSAARLARELGEERTIGALTKPDTVMSGEYGQWINILRGNAHRLKHGYFVTKQPSQEQLVRSISHAEARAQETEFFSNTEPWRTELSDLKERFGTQALQSYLANEFGELIRKTLPGIVETIQRQVDETNKELVKLPEPPADNQMLIVHNLLHKFHGHVTDHLTGVHGKNEFQQELRRQAEIFQGALTSVRPRLTVFPTFAEESKAAEIYSPPGKSLGEPLGSRPKRKDGVELPRSDEDRREFPRTLRKRWNGGEVSGMPAKKQKASGLEKEACKFTLPQIRYIIESTATARIPGQVDPKAINAMIRHSITLWRPLVQEFLEACGKLLNSFINQCFTKKFELYQKSPIFQAAFQILKKFLRDLFEEQKHRIERLWFLEIEQISTLNQEDYQTFMNSHLEVLQERRKRNLNDQRETEVTVETETARSVKKKTPAAVGMLKEDMLDPYRKEINVLAQVRAYNEIAQKRFVDNVYMSIQGEWVAKCHGEILKILQRELGLGEPDADEKCRELLVEDPQKELRRKQLLRKKEQLIRAMDEVYEVMPNLNQ